jgi:hypothetical protein
MTRNEMTEKISSDPALQEALDEIVIDRYCFLASELNNQGANAQLKWLEEVCGENTEEILSVISS